MERTGLYSLLYYLILNSPFMIYANAAFTEVPKDVSVGEGEDVEMPCAFKAVSSAPMSLEIQWWYLKEDEPKELPHELQISAPVNRAKITLREATKISTVRVQGNAISHRLSLSKVKKEDEGVYECRVSDLWADETLEFTVHAALHVTAGDGMIAEEAVSHIQNRWPLRNTNTALGGLGAGRATSEPGQGLAGGQRFRQGKHREPQQAQPGLLPSMLSPTASVVKSSASPLPGNAAILRQQHRSGTRNTIPSFQFGGCGPYLQCLSPDCGVLSVESLGHVSCPSSNVIEGHMEDLTSKMVCQPAVVRLEPSGVSAREKDEEKDQSYLG